MSIQVSVIITNYNNERYLGRAIRSCLNQSLDREKFEVIVVDDASTDNSLVVANSFDDAVEVIALKENVGVAEASNIGICKARGQYIVRVDSDDYINQHLLSVLSQILDWNKGVGFAYGDLLKVDNEENILDRVNLHNLDMVLRHGAGIMFRKDYLEAIGLYDKELRNAEDYDLIKRYIKNWDGFHVPLPLYRYRQHETNMTSNDEERKAWEKIADENRR